MANRSPMGSVNPRLQFNVGRWPISDLRLMSAFGPVWDIAIIKRVSIDRVPAYVYNALAGAISNRWLEAWTAARGSQGAAWSTQGDEGIHRLIRAFRRGD